MFLWTRSRFLCWFCYLHEIVLLELICLILVLHIIVSHGTAIGLDTILLLYRRCGCGTGSRLWFLLYLGTRTILLQNGFSCNGVGLLHAGALSLNTQRLILELFRSLLVLYELDLFCFLTWLLFGHLILRVPRSDSIILCQALRASTLSQRPLDGVLLDLRTIERARSLCVYV